MISKEVIAQALHNCLSKTDFSNLGQKIEGKVRDVYLVDNKRVLITTDRQSAFDYVLAEVPFKGQVLNQISAFWFDKTKDIVPNHLISTPDPNVTIAKECKMFPVEVVVRAYITGVTSTALWYNYDQGERYFCGNQLPEGLKKNQKLEKVIITPTTKPEASSGLHDEKISEAEILEQGLVAPEKWAKIKEYAFALFQRGTEIAASQGLILVDTKYEFGEDPEGNIVIADEVHTPDSSRFWIQETYQDRFSKGLEPESLDKEFLRLWMREHGFEYGKELPKITDEVIIDFSQKYINLYETITGTEFEAPDVEVPVNERIAENLKQAFPEKF